MDFSSREQENLHFTVIRLMTALFKTYLMMTQDVLVNHQEMLDKISQFIPESELDKLDLVDYLDENKYNHMRKRILDIGNDAIREWEKILQNYEVSFKAKGLDSGTSTSDAPKTNCGG